MSSEVTRLLGRLSTGEREAANELLPIVYRELRSLAAAYMARLPPGQTLQATALVHEAYLRLVGSGDPGWNGRGHFFGAAAQAIRQIIVDRARHKGAAKRGLGQRHEDLGAAVNVAAADPDLDEVLAIEAAVGRLEAEHPRKARVVILRYFGGLSDPEIAECLGVTTRTVEREWRFARAWMHAALGRTPS